uniref:Caspase-1 n=2 Tax=Cacopsylla melanoneura TaxID=428564 RepID=A0A8D8PZ91_9HEMI
MASSENEDCCVDGTDSGILPTNGTIPKDDGADSGTVPTNGTISKDEGDVIGLNFGRTKIKGPVGISTVERDAEYYRMNHAHRGLALIFNHEFFDSQHLRPRAGTMADWENLHNTLHNLGFEVITHHNAIFKEITNGIDEAASRDFTNVDCFIMAVLSHGENGILHAKDTAYKPENLWAKFTADKCITLAGKPKLFFIQACQGDGLDSGVTLRTQVDGPSDTFRIPSHADFLIAYSTIPGFYSWRNTQKGSWFIQALCAELQLHAYSKNLLSILTSVVRRVAFDFESNVPDSYEMHAKKQIPCFTSMLTRLVQFTPRGAIQN